MGISYRPNVTSALNGGGSLRTLGPVNTTQPVGQPSELTPDQMASAMAQHQFGQVAPPPPQPPMPPAWQPFLWNFNGPNPPVGNQPTDPYAPQYALAPAPTNAAPWPSSHTTLPGPVWSGSPQDRLLQAGQSPQGAYQGPGNLGQLGQAQMPAPSWWQSPRGR